MKQRNAGLAWVEKNAQDIDIFYFADDDNSYDPRVFEEVWYQSINQSILINFCR
jgi:hypothetical protein